MKAEKIIDVLKKSGARKILVTGPQRSGTRICAKIIACELDLWYVDEDDIGVDNAELVEEVLVRQHRAVVHCPGLAHIAHEIKCDAVVFVFRDIVDIIKSQWRISWDRMFGADEKEKYGAEKDPRPIAIIKYERWNEQKGLIAEANRTALDLDYETLSYHDLWVPKENRRGFYPTQTEQIRDSSV